MAESKRTRIAGIVSVRSIWKAALPAALYVLFCIAYIVISGRLAASLSVSADQLAAIENVKGIAFVVVTGLVLFVILFVTAERIRKDQAGREEAHDALRESEQRLRAVFHSVAGVPIQGYDSDRRVIFWNPASESLYGYSHDEAIGNRLEELIIPEESRQAVVEGIQQWHDLGIPIPSGEVELISKSGRRLQVYSNHVMISNHRGEREMFCIDVDLTERKRAEADLRRSEEKFRTFVENANDIIYQVSPDGIYTYASPNWTNILGHAPHEVIGEAVDAFVHPDDLQLCIDFLHLVLSTGAKQSGVEYRVRHKDGSWRWHSSNGAPVKDAHGESVSYIGIARDITELKEQEQSRLALYQRYQTVVRNFPNGAVFLFDSKMRYIHVEGKALRQVGLVPDSMIGKTVKEVFPPEVSNVAYENQMRLLEGRTCYYEVEFAGNIYANWGEPVVNDKNQIEEGVIFSVDISEHKRAEEALRESEELLNRTGDMAQVGGWEVDLETLGVIWTRTTRRIHELPDGPAPNLEEAIGYYHPEDREHVRQCIQRAIEDAEPFDFTARLITAQGRERWVRALGQPVFDADRCVKLSGTFQDITERKFAEAEREGLSAQLQQAQKMEAVGRLAGGVAHDFNNMLNVILGHADMMLDDLPADSPLRGDLDEIRLAAGRSADLTRQLLAFARRQTVAPRDLALNETVATTLKMLQRLIGEDIDLLWKPAAEPDGVRIDPGQVNQILANLAINARDAIGHAHGKVTIETRNVRFDEAYCAAHPGFMRGDYVMLAVSDDGCGMDEETRANIFEPFFTTKDVGEGTGLGLATVYGIVKQNDGFVHVYSEQGQGTSFKIYLPALCKASLGAASAEAHADLPGAGNETILVVEDQPSLLKMTQRMLTRRGYTVLIAATPGEALHLVREQPGGIDLLITDVVMPEMNGRELAEQLQALRPGLKSLFMSGYTADVIAHQGVLDKDVHFIQKPFSQDDLVRKARETLDA